MPNEMGEVGVNAVGLGMRVEVALLDAAGAAEPLAFDVVADRQADFDAGFLGAGTPLVQAVWGRRPGAVVSYPMADIVRVRVVRVTPSTRTPGVQTDRDAAVREAVERSNLEDMVRLALTVDVKWGDYDPEGIVPADEPEKPDSPDKPDEAD
jgi:hypothetical protein